jgi:hypothetical protein
MILFELVQHLKRLIRKYFEIVSYLIENFYSSNLLSFFSSVQREVEQQIQNLRTLFRQRLTEFPSSIDDQKLFIRYLHSLDPRADPAWDCIIHQKTALINELRSRAVDPKQQQQQSMFFFLIL